MNATEISKVSFEKPDHIIGFPAYSGFRSIAFWLREIAFQLARGNELKESHRYDHLDSGDPR